MSPAEASEESEALDQVLEAAAVSVEPVDEAAAATATLEETGPAEGVVPDAAPADAAPAEPAEPEFDEVWFPGGRRQNDNRRHEGRQRREGEDGQRQNNRPRHGKGPRRPDGEDRGHAGKPHNGKGRPDKPDRGERKDRRPPREDRKPVFDPDSPFAALAALRGKSE